MALAWLLSHLKFKTIMKGIKFMAAAAAQRFAPGCTWQDFFEAEEAAFVTRDLSA